MEWTFPGFLATLRHIIAHVRGFIQMLEGHGEGLLISKNARVVAMQKVVCCDSDFRQLFCAIL